MLHVQIDRVNSDAERSEIEAFFTSHIHDVNRFPLMARAIDPLKGFPSYILTVRDAVGLIGALHAGAAAGKYGPMSVMDFQLRKSAKASGITP